MHTGIIFRHSLVQQSQVNFNWLSTNAAEKQNATRFSFTEECLMMSVAQVKGLLVSIIGVCALVKRYRFCIALESDCYFEDIRLKTLVIVIVDLDALCVKPML